MIDKELELLKNWRFCKIPYGEKGPRYKDWQRTPYTLNQIPDNNNIGVILGPASNGLLAIDFDGPWAWDYWNENIKISFNSFDTVMWTSNKPGRCQMAFIVPPEFWAYMPTLFKRIGPLGDDGKHQAIEFRWGNDERGCQSVLPPSLHPDNKIDPNINYTWLRKPSEVRVCNIMPDLLEFIYNEHISDSLFVPEVEQYEPKDVTGEEANKLCEQLKKYYSTLDYDTWIRVTWAFCNTIGYSDGIAIMKYYYPEQKKGEYDKLMKSKPSGKVCTIGTVIKMIKDKGGFQQESTKTPSFNGITRQEKKMIRSFNRS